MAFRFVVSVRKALLSVVCGEYSADQQDIIALHFANCVRLHLKKKNIFLHRIGVMFSSGRVNVITWLETVGESGVKRTS